MSVRTDKIQLFVDVKGDKAKSELNELKKKAAHISDELKGMKKNTQEYIDKNKELNQVSKNIADLKKQIGLSALSLRDLNQEAAKLTSLRNNVTPGTKAFHDFDTQLETVKARINEVKQGMAGFQKVSAESGSAIGKVFTRVAEYGAAYFAFDKIKEFFSGTVEEAEQAEKSLSRLHNTLDNLGRGDAFDRIVDKANQLAKQFNYLDNDDITEVFQQLITYGKLTEGQMDKLLPVIINFAAKSATSVNESASLIIKAMEGNAKALKEYGISIKDGADVSERFAIIMSQLAPKVEGAAAAFQDSFSGSVATSKQEVKDLQEEIGTKMLPILQKFYQSVSYVIDGLKTIFSEVGRDLGNLFKTVGLLGGILKDVVTGDIGNIPKRITLLTSENDQLEKSVETQKQLNLLRSAAKSVATDAETKPLIEQQKILKDSIVLKEASLKRYNDLVSPGKQLTDEGKAAAKEFFQDAQTVIELQKVLAQTKDKKVLGNGDPYSEVNKKDAKEAEQQAKQKAQEQKREHEQLLKQAEDFHKELQGLQYKSSEASKTTDQKELDDAQRKWDELLVKYDSFVKKLKGKDLSKFLINNSTSADLDEAKRNELNAIIEKQHKAAFEKEQKEQKNNLTKGYADQLQAHQAFYEDEKNRQAQRFADGEISKAQYEENIRKIDIASKQDQLATAEEFAKLTVTLDGKIVPAVEQSAKDVTRIKKEQLDQQRKDLLAAHEAQIADKKLVDDLEEEAARHRLETRVNIAKSKGDINGEFNAKKKLY